MSNLFRLNIYLNSIICKEDSKRTLLALLQAELKKDNFCAFDKLKLAFIEHDHAKTGIVSNICGRAWLARGFSSIIAFKIFLHCEKMIIYHHIHKALKKVSTGC